LITRSKAEAEAVGARDAAGAAGAAATFCLFAFDSLSKSDGRLSPRLCDMMMMMMLL
jgi:hypothetical protein